MHTCATGMHTHTHTHDARSPLTGSFIQAREALQPEHDKFVLASLLLSLLLQHAPKFHTHYPLLQVPPFALSPFFPSLHGNQNAGASTTTACTYNNLMRVLPTTTLCVYLQQPRVPTTTLANAPLSVLPAKQ